MIGQLVAEKISFSYRKELIFQDLDFTLSQDDFVLMNGPNGAGKTTLISLLLGFLKPQGGRITMQTDESHSTQVYSYLPQRNSFFNTPMRCLDLVASAFLKSNSLFRFGYKENRERARAKMEELGLHDFIDKDFSSLSGGQAQKVLLARILCHPGAFIFLDESFSNMDKDSRRFFLDCFYRLKGLAGILLISHDMDIIAEHKDKFAYLNHGKIITYNSVRDMEESFFHMPPSEEIIR